MRGISRREALGAGGLMLAGAPVRARSGQARGNVRKLTIGCNLHVWDRVRKDVPLAGAVRVYYNEENVFPGSWPHHAPGAWVTLSIRPNPRALLAGQLDSALLALARSAPRHAHLSLWHEATPANPRGYPRYINPSSLLDMYAYVIGLTAGTSVRTGPIICGPANQMADWIPRAQWYGFDSYDNDRFHNKDGTLSRDAIWHRYDQNRLVFQRISGQRRPVICICESNCGEDSHRANWFTFQAQWLAANGGRRLLTFWQVPGRARQGSLSGPWPPARHVVSRLRWLTSTYR